MRPPPTTPQVQSGWRAYWHHPTERDQCRGSWWPDRESAEWIADALRRDGARNVRVLPSMGTPDDA